MAVALGSAATQAGPGHERALARSKQVDSEAVEALDAIPVEGTIVITNDLAFDERTAGHLPLMNSWAPAVHGHQFWANNFMHDLGCPDVGWRFQQQERFWREPVGPWQAGFLERDRIGWILQRKDLPRLDLSRWRKVSVVFENEKYLVARVLGDSEAIGGGGGVNR